MEVSRRGEVHRENSDPDRPAAPAAPAKSRLIRLQAVLVPEGSPEVPIFGSCFPTQPPEKVIIETRGRHCVLTMQQVHDVLQNGTPDTSLILWTNVTPIN